MFPGHNIVSSQSVVTIRQDAREPVRKLSTMRRGLLPSRAKDMSIGYKTINVRAETVATTSSFREPFKSQCCLVLARVLRAMANAYFYGKTLRQTVHVH